MGGGGGNWKLEVGSDQERPSLPQARFAPEPQIAASAFVSNLDNSIVPHNTLTLPSHNTDPTLHTILQCPNTSV